MNKEKLSEKAKEIFGAHVSSVYGWGNEVHIELSNPNNVSFDALKKLSDLLGTTNINLGDYSKSSGCPTCDYGATEKVTITCKDTNMEL